MSADITKEVGQLLSNLNHDHLEKATLVSEGSLSFNTQVKPSVDYSKMEPQFIPDKSGSYVLNNIGKQYEVVASDQDSVTIELADLVGNTATNHKIDKVLFEELFLKLQ